jgi:hypothetical protein
MADGAVIKKLGLKPGHRSLFLNAPEGYVASLGPLPNGVEVATEPDGAFDVVHLFVRAKAEIDQLAPVAMAATKPAGRLWISYPKRSARVPTDVTRDVGWEAVDAAGWLGVAQISIDDVWSALRFRPEADIPRLTRVRPAPPPAERATSEGEPT